jgi:membrane protein DedA with SNARE-associated domain
MEQHLVAWLARYKAPVIFTAQLLGIFGLPIPDELLLTAAGDLVRRGALDGRACLLAAILGCMSGITVSYVLGRTLGCAAVTRLSRGHEQTVGRTQAWFRRFGAWLLAFGYFIPGVRHVTAIAAGSAPMPFARFAAFAYPGAVLWSTTFVALGYYAGEHARDVFASVRPHVTAAAITLAVVAAVYALVATRRDRANA